MFKNSKKGVSLYLALMIMFILLAIGLGVSLIIVSQMKMMKGMGDSVIAFYAADTGIERALYEKRVNNVDWSGFGTVGGADYTVDYIVGPPATWKSKGSFGSFAKVKRAIEITIPSTPPPPPSTYTQSCDGDCGDAPCVSADNICLPENPSLTCSKSTGDCSIPTPPYCPDPLPNSYSTGGTCSCHAFAFGDICATTCVLGACVDSTTCDKTGNCTYACDDGYTWNGTACVP